ncbi:MAG: YggS family pyridoxal phosphate-dependent enzyme [Pleurocapsa sp.]
MTGSIAQKIHQITRQIPDSVRLVAVSKQVPVTKIREAYQAGVRDFGENRLQEALFKQQQLQDLPDICWHFIGHIQKNKAKKIVENFPWIHSVDSLVLARYLDKLAAELSCHPKVCLQVKILPDPNKYGWDVPELRTDLPELDQLQNLHIQGLMIILPLGLNERETAIAFANTRQLATEIAAQNWTNISMQQLSMGMSEDYLLAIAAGATMIRLGRTIFGERQTNV